MPTYIVKMADDQGTPWYLFWSTVVDAPTTCAMTLDEMKEYYRDEYGRQGMRDLDDRLARVEATGTSCRYPDSTAESTIGVVNRAGKGETWLSAEQTLRLSIMRRDDIDFEMQGVDQDMVCCMCSKPIENELDRVWEGSDPYHAACVVEREHHSPEPG
jgi:hypothetical protein